jgi:hypothetical protein
LSQFGRHFRCSHADHITSPSTDSGLAISITSFTRMPAPNVHAPMRIL